MRLARTIPNSLWDVKTFTSGKFKRFSQEQLPHFLVTTASVSLAYVSASLSGWNLSPPVVAFPRTLSAVFSPPVGGQGQGCPVRS